MSIRDPSLHLDVEGCFNVRDAGGWSTTDGRWMRTGVLYRADDPVRLTTTGREAIARLGLKAVVDLRQKSQFDRGPGFADRSITHHIPVVDRVINIDDPPPIEQPGDIAGLYGDMAIRGEAELVRVIDTLATYVGEGPVMVHCAAGKDRTGMIVALIQAAIGVGLDEIVKEYALSDRPPGLGARRWWTTRSPTIRLWPARRSSCGPRRRRPWPCSPAGGRDPRLPAGLAGGHGRLTGGGRTPQGGPPRR